MRGEGPACSTPTTAASPWFARPSIRTNPRPFIPTAPGAHVILAIGFEASHQRRVSSLLRFAFQLSSVASNNLLRANFAFYNAVHHDEIIPVVPQFEERISPFDTDKIPYLVDAGAQAVEQELPYLRQLLERAPA